MIFLGCLKISWTDPPVCVSAECPPGTVGWTNLCKNDTLGSSINSALSWRFLDKTCQNFAFSGRRVIGNCCVCLRMLKSPKVKSPHKEVYSFKLTMLWLSLSSSLSLPKYLNQYAQPQLWPKAPPCCIDSALCLDRYMFLGSPQRQRQKRECVESMQHRGA